MEPKRGFCFAAPTTPYMVHSLFSKLRKATIFLKGLIFKGSRVYALISSFNNQLFNSQKLLASNRSSTQCPLFFPPKSPKSKIQILNSFSPFPHLLLHIQQFNFNFIISQIKALITSTKISKFP